MKIVALAAAAALILSSCSSMGIEQLIVQQVAKPAPTEQPNKTASSSDSSGPQASQGTKVDAAAELAKYQNVKNSDKSFPASGPITPASMGSQNLTAGEWAVYRVFEGDKIQSVLKQAVIGKQGDVWVYEFVSYSKDESAAIQFGLKGLDKIIQSGDAEKGQIVWMKVKDKEGKITTLDGAMLGMAGGAYKGLLASNGYSVSTSLSAGGPVTVPAGTFASTLKVQSKVAHGRSNESGTAYVSTIVPLYHVVKSVSDNGRFKMELLDFGTSGYVSAF